MKSSTKSVHFSPDLRNDKGVPGFVDLSWMECYGE